jgi:hypothetical protein
MNIDAEVQEILEDLYAVISDSVEASGEGHYVELDPQMCLGHRPV